MSLIAELKRRGVIRVTLAYLAASWLLIQVGGTVFPAFSLPPAALPMLIIVLAVGIVPVVVLSWKFELTATGLQPDEGRARGSDYSRQTARYLDRTITALLVIGISYFAIDKFVFDPTRDAEQMQTAREEGRADALVESYGDKSIAVLPFVNMSADPEQEYFSDGISEELLNLLAKIPELRVISRSTSFTFKGTDIAISEVAKKLNVAHILEGSVRRSGNRLRITAQLIDARTDTHLWSETYDRELEDIFAIQDEIAARVVADLKLKLLGSAPRAEEIDPRAHELFLRGGHFLNNVASGDDVDDVVEAAALLEKAVELQPDWASAYSELIFAYVILSNMLPDQEAHYERLAWARLDELFKIDRVGDLAYGWKAHLTWEWRGDLQLAAGYFERATALIPHNLDNLRSISYFLGDLQRYDEAIAVSEFVVARDPGCGPCVSELAYALRTVGRHREAAARLEATLEWHPPNDALFWHLGVAWLVAGEPKKALAAFDRMDQPPGENLGRLLALHELGRMREFEEEFAQFREVSADNVEGIARVYAWIGKNDEAFLWLDRMVEQQGPESVALVKTDLYAKLKADPRWQAFLAKYGKSDEDLGRIVFNPVYPPEIEAALHR